jgi:hypothetical protein
VEIRSRCPVYAIAGVSRRVKQIVQLNFKFRNPRAKVEKHWLEHAHIFGPKGEIKGLLWKIWLMNATEKSAGGIYLFKDEATARAYANGDIVKGIPNFPDCSAYDVEVRVWDILPKHTKITLGPVD